MSDSSVEQLSGQLLDIALGSDHSDLDEEIDSADTETSDLHLVAGLVDELHILKNSITVTPATEREYEGLVKNWQAWLLRNNHINPDDDPFDEVLSPRTPILIIAWIMENCDSSYPNGTPKPSTQQRSSYNHAQKMRAALAYAYGKSHKRGTEAWKKIPNSEKYEAGKKVPNTERYEGNPTTSTVLRHYMKSLRKRKYDAGEKSVSSKALTVDDIDKIYRIMEENEGQDGELPMALIHVTVTIAFTCLLRIDEVLNLQFDDVVGDENRLTITLKSRKTAQFGGIKPFVLYRLPPTEESICPLRALSKWINLASPSGRYIFPGIRTHGRCSSRDVPITQPSWLKYLRALLSAIELDYTYYGGHSCRRGGAQWLARINGWPVHRICDWGGWSMDSNHAILIRYLFSENDNPLEAREDYMRPDNNLTCSHCGR